MASRKGCPNKIKKAARELAEQLGVDPLEILLHIAKGDWESLGYESATTLKVSSEGAFPVDRISLELRASAAKEAVKYVYPTLKSTELHNGEGEGFRVLIEDYATKKEA